MVASWESGEGANGWVLGIAGVFLVAVALLLGYGFGYYQAAHHPAIPQAPAPADTP
jgi:hypothetical protein